MIHVVGFGRISSSRAAPPPHLTVNDHWHVLRPHRNADAPQLDGLARASILPHLSQAQTKVGVIGVIGWGSLVASSVMVVVNVSEPVNGVACRVGGLCPNPLT